MKLSAETVLAWRLRRQILEPYARVDAVTVVRRLCGVHAATGADELAIVDVDGTPAYARTADVDAMARTRPTDVVRLLPAFDQYVLGPGTNDTVIIPARRRPQISKAAGWISPVLVAGGRVAGTWGIEVDVLAIALVSEAQPLPRGAVENEASRLSGLRGQNLQLSVRID